MAETDDLAWCKLYHRWYTSRSHVNLSGVALNLGPCLMSLANASSERGWLLTKAGRPITVAGLAVISRFTEQQVAAALEELIECETLTLRADGAVGFERFEWWQESPQARRTREWRMKSDQGASLKRHTGRHGDVTVTTEDRGQRTEVRSEKKNSHPVAAAPDSLVVFSCKTTPKNPSSEWGLRPKYLEKLCEAYPNIDVLAEMRVAAAWCEGNEADRPTANGMGRFLNSWLQKTSRRAVTAPNRTPPQRLTQAQQGFAEYERLRALETEREHQGPAQRVLRISDKTSGRVARSPPELLTPDLFESRSEMC